MGIRLKTARAILICMIKKNSVVMVAVFASTILDAASILKRTPNRRAIAMLLEGPARAIKAESRSGFLRFLGL